VIFARNESTPDGRRHAGGRASSSSSTVDSQLQRDAARADDNRAMTHTFVVNTEHGERVYTGHVSSRSPSTITLLLTTPYGLAGRVVTFPVADVISEHQAA
jgi:hypothetical protein